MNSFHDPYLHEMELCSTSQPSRVRRLATAQTTILWLAAAALSLSAETGLAKMVYVKPTGDNTASGLTWATAKQTVQAGLDTAASGDEVWTAAGTYVERITLKSGVALYGGFAGSETTRPQRQWKTNETILDGNRGRVVTSPTGATPSTRIDGFTIRNGEAYGSNGAGIYCYQSSPRISNNLITQNAAGDDGAGIYCQDSSPIIASNTITLNIADNNGCGISCRGGSPVICNNVITGNRLTYYGGGIFLYRSAATISNNIIIGNRAGSQGGGIYCQECSPVIANNTIASNTAVEAGAIYSRDSSPTIVNTILALNSSGILKYGTGTVTVQYSCFYGNTQYNASGMTDPTGTQGNLSADPRFARIPSAGKDATWATSDDDYGNVRLSSGSPCIDSGSNTRRPADLADLDGDGDTSEPLPFDLDGISRSMNDSTIGDTGEGNPPIVDIGAYELRDRIQEVPAEYLTIQTAIDAAQAGDEVVIANGTYSGPGNTELDLRGKAITVRSASGAPGSCVIDCAGQGRGFVFFRGEGATSIIKDLSIVNGSGGIIGRGGGICCENNSSPTIRNCVIRGGVADMGGGVFCDSGNASLKECVIVGNSARDGGGVFTAGGAKPSLIRCVIADNAAEFGGGLHCWSAGPTLTGCTIHGNHALEGGGVFAFSGQTDFSNTVIAVNQASRGGAFSGYETVSMMVNSTVVANVATSGSAVALGSYLQANPSKVRLSNCILRNGTGQISNDDGSSLTMTYCDVQDGASGQGNIDLDPLFVDTDGPDNDPNTWVDNDYRLSPGSRCIDAGDNAAVPQDLLDVDQDGNTSELLPLDLAGSPRFMDDSATLDTGHGTLPIVDIGAYEVRDTVLIVPGEYSTIQAAIDAALPGEQIALLDGVFSGTGNKNLNIHGKRIRIRSNSGDPAKCIIDCQGSGRGFLFASGEGPDSIIEALTIINGSADLGGGICCQDSSPSITRCVIRACTALVDGGGLCCVLGQPGVSDCTIENNSAGSGNGGGICCRQSKPTLTGCTIRANSAAGGSGGGLYCYRSDASLTHCTLNGNSGKTDGGGLCFDESHPLLNDCTVTNNSAAAKGGGIRCSLGNPRLTNCTITDNVSNGTAPEHGGGGLYCSQSNPTIVNSVIRGNQAAAGGGLYCIDSGPSLNQTTITGNSSKGDHYTHGGGGLYCRTGAPSLNRCAITNNTSKFWGGGVLCNGAKPVLTQCQIAANSANYGAGGGLYYTGPDSVSMLVSCQIRANSAYSGGGVCCDGADVSLANSAITSNKAVYKGGAAFTCGSNLTVEGCTLAANTARMGPALACESYQPSSQSTVSASNCILWNGSTQIWNDDGSTLAFSYCDIQGGWPGSGNLDADPRFLDPDGRDGDPNTWGDNDYRLSVGSPCIDAGDNANVALDTADLDGDGDTSEHVPFDLAELARFFDNPLAADTGAGTAPIVDIGAYESHHTQPSDLDGDGDVDAGDLTLFGACVTGPAIPYDPSNSGCPLLPNSRGYIAADFDEDHDVDQDDFGVLQRSISQPSTKHP